MEDLVIVVVGLAFVLLGVFQYMQEQDKRSDKRRQELFAELEEAKLQNIYLKGVAAREKRLRLEAAKAAKECRAAYEKLKKS